MSSLIRHVHDFARETELTVDEWMLGVQFLNAVGQISNGQRNEGQRISDVIGLESYALSNQPFRPRSSVPSSPALSHANKKNQS
jgi:Catechol dioxygenase N terminus